MIRRIRCRKEVKLNNQKIIAIFCIAMFFLGTAYSSVNQVLTLSGTAKIYSSSSDDGKHLEKGNLDAYIISVENIGRYNGDWTVQLTFRLYNPNDFDASNWTAQIYAPGLTGANDSNVDYYSYDATTEVVTLQNVKASSQSKIAQGESKDFGNINLTFSSDFIDALVDSLTDEEKAVMTEADKNIINGVTTGDCGFSEDFDSILASKIVYNMDASPEPTANMVEISASTEQSSEDDEPQAFSYTFGDLTFNVSYADASTVNWNGSYSTSATIEITNNNTEYSVTSFGFDMVYNEELDSSAYTYLACYDLDTNNENYKTTTSSKWWSWDRDSIAAGATNTYTISGIYSVEKFKSFVFQNVKYTLSDGTSVGDDSDTETDTNTTNEVANVTNTNIVADNTSSNVVENTTTVENVAEVTIENETETNNATKENTEEKVNTSNTTETTDQTTDNPLTVSYSYTDDTSWQYDVMTATITFTNTGDTTITAVSFDVVYNAPATEEHYNNVSAWWPVDMGTKTVNSISLTSKSGVTIPAGGTMTFSIYGIDQTNGCTGVSVENIVCSY